ncbi:Acriflavin resistance protein [hydrothermal vent metagenome]|uniref:Acriflavin resistance protein n=1 Tax=hydrothermal vent metagenome TaxID=652676 RepID=A0A3B1CCS7_9ZZZZ
MRGVFGFFAERHLFANLFTLIILLLGVSTLFTIKRDIFPNVDVGQMVITTEYPGASPEDVELNVTNKIEKELKGIVDIKRVTSVSSENISSIMIDIEPDAEDPKETKDEIRRAVGRVSDFPVEVTDNPYVLDIKTPFDPFIEVGITGDIPYRELRELARLFEKKLENLPGVSRTARFGYRDREVRIEVLPDALLEYQMPLRDIISAIQGRNIRATGGSLESYTSEKNVVTLSQFRDPKEAEEVIVRSTFDGPALKVKNLARVKDGFEEEKIISRMNGRKAISFRVFNKPLADVIRTSERVKQLIDSEQKKMPEGVKIIYSNDASKYVLSTFRIVIFNGSIGLALVVILLALFLNIRIAFWVALGIPVTFLGAIFLLPVFGVYLDTIVLTAMIIVIGIIVDDAIIVSENIYMSRERGESPLESGIHGITSVYRPVLTTILTTFIAFAPMFFMPGMMGKFVYVIPLTVSLALFISMMEVSIALPAHLVHSLEKSPAPRDVMSHGRWFNLVRRAHGWVIVIFLRLRYLFIILFMAVFAGALYYAANYMSFVLFPTKGAEMFLMSVELPIGSSLTATSDKIKKIEKIIHDLPESELESFSTRVGMSLIMGGPAKVGENYGSLIVNLAPWSGRARSADQIVESIRNKIGKIKGIEKVTFSIDSGGPPIGKAVTIHIIGSDDSMRKELTGAVEKHLNTVKGVKDIERDDGPGKQQVEIKVDYEKLARLGLTVADIAQNIRIAYDGQVVTSVRYGEEDVDFRVILEEKARKKLSYLNRLSLTNRQGRLIALKEVAKLEIGPGPNDTHHFDRERATTVTADVLQDVITPLEVTGGLLAKFNLDKDYPGMRFKVGGEAQETEESMRGLYIAFGMAAVGIYFLLILLFNSVTQPLIVLLAIPFGLVGVIAAFSFHGESFGFLAMLGVVGMSGVVVNDSLVLVNHINQLRLKNPSAKTADLVVQGTSDRLRAILMTTFTTVAGLLPLAYGIGGSDIYMGPMALALGYGILFATPLTLGLIPCLYMAGDDLRRIFSSKPKQA